MSWTAPDNAGRPAITEYDLQYRVSGELDLYGRTAGRARHRHQRDDHGSERRHHLPGAGTGRQRRRPRSVVGARQRRHGGAAGGDHRGGGRPGVGDRGRGRAVHAEPHGNARRRAGGGGGASPQKGAFLDGTPPKPRSTFVDGRHDDDADRRHGRRLRSGERRVGDGGGEAGRGLHGRHAGHGHRGGARRRGGGGRGGDAGRESGGERRRPHLHADGDHGRGPGAVAPLRVLRGDRYRRRRCDCWRRLHAPGPAGRGLSAGCVRA